MLKTLKIWIFYHKYDWRGNEALTFSTNSAGILHWLRSFDYDTLNNKIKEYEYTIADTSFSIVTYKYEKEKTQISH